MKAEITQEEGRQLLAKLIGGELPDAHGRYGPFGGSYAPETLVTALERLAANVHRYLDDPDFMAHLDKQLRTWVGRPTPLTGGRFVAEVGRRGLPET